jgi:hypothetical protein
MSAPTASAILDPSVPDPVEEESAAASLAVPKVASAWTGPPADVPGWLLLVASSAGFPEPDGLPSDWGFLG